MSFQLVSPELIQQAASLLRKGELVAFPTETVYGLGANALDESAVAKIFTAKGRPSDNPLIVHVDSLDSARDYVSEIDAMSEKLANKFWPGPLTLILPIKVSAGIAKNVSAGLDTVGVRVPDHPVALAILEKTKLPLAAPSANKSGSPSPTRASHVSSDFEGNEKQPALILDGGACRVGLESTVVQIKNGTVHILRPGGVSANMIAVSLGLETREIQNSFALETDISVAPRAPGMKYRHYAPLAAVLPVQDITSFSGFLKGDVLLSFDSITVPHVRALSLGASPEHLETACNRLFDLFRMADSLGASRIIVDCSFDISSGLGLALWNRISKAASKSNFS